MGGGGSEESLDVKIIKRRSSLQAQELGFLTKIILWPNSRFSFIYLFPDTGHAGFWLPLLVPSSTQDECPE